MERSPQFFAPSARRGEGRGGGLPNRRIARWADTNGNGASDREEFYVYDGDDVVLDFVDANGATGGVSPVLKTRYLHGPAVDQILAQEEIDTTTGDSADVLWMLTDHLGSVRDIVNQAGEAVNHVTYDAFGNIVGGTGVLLTRYLYTGRELDTLTGLQYNRNRWYDPALGRWVSEDPIGFEGGDYNQARYVFNSPTIFIDPEGTIFWFAAAAAVGVYWFWPATANAPAPGDPLVPSDPYGGLGPAAFTGLSPGWSALGAAEQWASENDLLPKHDIPPDAKIGMCPAPGRFGKQARLRKLRSDPNVSSADRGWIQQELNEIKRGQRSRIRVPPGKNLAHRRGHAAKDGHGYEHSDLQDIGLHKLQHKHEGY